MAHLVLTLHKDSIAKLDSLEKQNTHKSLYLMLNSSNASGKTITIKGVTRMIPVLPSTSTAVTEKDKINAIINDPDGKTTTKDGLADALTLITNGTATVNVTSYPSIPGLLKLTAVSGSLWGTTTTSGEVTIVPAMDSTIELHPNSTYKLQILGKFTDGSMKELNFTDVKWMYQPTNRISSTSLNSGLLEKGDTAGTT